MRLAFYLGTFYPDILYKSLFHITKTSDYALIPIHTPIGIFFCCYLLTMLFEERLRWSIFISLYLGSLLHILVDMLKYNLGLGSSALLFPFTTDGYEFGLYSGEDIVYLLPLNLVIIVALELVARRRKNVQQ